MNRGVATARLVRGQNFEACAKDGYVYERVWGTLTIEAAERSAEAMMHLGRTIRCRNLAIDLQGLDWINNLTLRRRGIELFYRSTQVYDHIALISSRPAINYLVEIMARAAGLNVRSFTTEPAAAEWLRGI